MSATRGIARLAALPEWLRSRLGALWWLRHCDHVGAGTRANWKPRVDNQGHIEIGARVRLNSHWAPLEIVSGARGRIVIGDGVYLNYGSLIHAEREVRIGANAMIGNYCIIADCEAPGLPLDGAADEAKPIEIGENVWLAARVTVLPGARIGAGAVIAAGSVVAGEIPAGAVAAGIPARVTRIR